MKNSIKILIADDENLARKRILKLLGELDLNLKTFEASSGKETMAVLNNEQPDIVFLDIQMTDMNGFDVLNSIDQEDCPIIIFVTAFDNFAVRAFEVQAIDFLLKPYRKERFIEALQRGLSKLETEQKKLFQNKLSDLMNFMQNETKPFNTKKYLEKLVLKHKKSYYFVEVEQIKYIISSSYYAEIFTLDKKKHLYRISMSDLIDKLDPEEFIRISRSTIINLSCIKEVISEGAGDFSVVMKDNEVFTLTKNYKTPFLNRINIKNN